MSRNLTILAAAGFVCMIILLWGIVSIATHSNVEKSTKNDDETNSIIDERKRIGNKPESPSNLPNDANPSLGKTLDPAAIYANSKGAVATIETKDDLGFDAYQGSGVFVDPSWIKSRYKNFTIRQSVAEHSQKHPNEKFHPIQDTYLLTNHHVIESAAEAVVLLEDGRQGIVCDVVMEREDLDLALLQCVIWKSPKPVAILQIAKGSAPPIGEKVYTIGSPDGLEASLSEGIISGKREIIPGISWLQTTAPISTGSSGGPLLNSSGEVIGVVTASRRKGQNLNIAISASHIVEFLKGPCNSREIWRGTGIREEAENAYRLADAALLELKKNGKIDVLLGEAYRQILLLKDEAGYDQLMQSLTNTQPSQFGEHEYLYYYTIGKAALWHALKHIRSTRISGSMTLAEVKEIGKNNKDLQLAKKSFIKSIELKSEFSPAYKELSLCLHNEGRFSEALKVADILVKKVPNCPTAYQSQGTALNVLKNHLAARVAFKTAAELGPGDPDGYYYVAQECSYLNENEEAIEAYTEAIHLKCEPAGLCYYNMGVIYKRMGKYEQALTCFEKAKESDIFVEQCNKHIIDCRRWLK